MPKKVKRPVAPRLWRELLEVRGCSRVSQGVLNIRYRASKVSDEGCAEYILSQGLLNQAKRFVSDRSSGLGIIRPSFHQENLISSCSSVLTCKRFLQF